MQVQNSAPSDSELYKIPDPVRSGKSFMADKMCMVRETEVISRKLWRVQYAMFDMLITKLLVLVCQESDLTPFNLQHFGDNVMSIFLSGELADSEKFPLALKLEFMKISYQNHKKQHILQLMSNFDDENNVFYIYSNKHHFSFNSISSYVYTLTGLEDSDVFLQNLHYLSRKLSNLPRSLIILINLSFLWHLLPKFAKGLAEVNSKILYIIERFQKGIKVLNILIDYYDLTEFLEEITAFVHTASDIGLFELSERAKDLVF